MTTPSSPQTSRGTPNILLSAQVVAGLGFFALGIVSVAAFFGISGTSLTLLCAFCLLGFAVAGHFASRRAAMDTAVELERLRIIEQEAIGVIDEFSDEVQLALEHTHLSPTPSGGSKVISGINTALAALTGEARFREERLRLLVETAADGIITIMENARIQSFNPAAEQLFGYSEAEVIGKNINILMPPPFADEHDGYLQRYFRTGRRSVIGGGRDVMAKRRDGTTFPIYLTVGEMYHDNERIFVGFIRDISELQDVVLALEETNKNLVIETDLATARTALADDLRGEHDYDEIAKRSLNHLMNFVQGVAGALYAVDHDGMMRLSMRRSPDGVAEMVTANDDQDQSVSVRVFEAERSSVPDGATTNPTIEIPDPARHSGRTLLLETYNGSCRVIIKSPNHDQLVSLFGVDFGERYRDRPVFLQPLVDRKKVIGIAVMLCEWDLEQSGHRFLDEVAELVAIHLQMAALRDRLQDSIGELENNRDMLEQQATTALTQYVELEKARGDLERKAHDLERANQYKSDFLATMSHELRTPLNSMLVLSKMLADNVDNNLSNEEVGFAKVVNDSGYDLLNLINDILDLSKIEAGRLEVFFHKTPITDITSGLEKTFAPLAAQKSLGFSIVVGHDVPVFLCTDAQRLMQILKNFLSNAIKFTSVGDVSLEVCTRRPQRQSPDADQPPESICFRVTDAGIGIGPDQLEAIFEPFTQGESGTTRRYGGTGLGLTICKKLETLLGAEITVASVQNEGSVFTVCVPVEAPATT